MQVNQFKLTLNRSLLMFRWLFHVDVHFCVCVCMQATVRLHSLSHPVNLSFHNLFALCLPPTLSAASHFAVYCWKPVGLGGAGQPENTSGVGMVAAKRDGYNNPCSGSTHVLNYCHKFSSIRPWQDHQSHSALTSPDAFSFSVTKLHPDQVAPPSPARKDEVKYLWRPKEMEYCSATKYDNYSSV